MERSPLNKVIDLQNDAKLVNKLQHKLETLTKQVYKWKATSKVLEQRGNVNYDIFLDKHKASKSRNYRQEWSSLSVPQQYQVLKHIAKEHNRVHLDFEGLDMAMKQSLISLSLRKAFGLEEGGEKDCSDDEEKSYVNELLEEHSERSEKIVKAEEERVDKELELMEAKCQLAEKFNDLRKEYAVLIADEEESMNADKPSGTAIEKKQSNLELEEERADQMKIMIQKLLMSVPIGCCNIGTEDQRKKSQVMFIKCGQDIDTLRSERLT